MALTCNADISRIAHVYNLNLLIVVLAIVMFHELPDRGDAIRVLAGAALVDAGGVLVSV